MYTEKLTPDTMHLTKQLRSRCRLRFGREGELEYVAAHANPSVPGVILLLFFVRTSVGDLTRYRKPRICASLRSQKGEERVMMGYIFFLKHCPGATEGLHRW